jgi:hypothetical protein
MAIMISLTLEGVPIEAAEEVNQRLGVYQRPPAGLIVHFAYEVGIQALVLPVSNCSEPKDASRWRELSRRMRTFLARYFLGHLAVGPHLPDYLLGCVCVVARVSPREAITDQGLPASVAFLLP